MDLLFLVVFTVVGAFTLVLSGCGAPDDGGLFEARPSSTTLRASPSSSSVPAATSSAATAAQPAALPSDAAESGTPAPAAAPARLPAPASQPLPVTPADGPEPRGADDSADPEQAEPPAAAVPSTIRIDRARWDEEKESLELRGEVSSPVVKLTAEFLDRSAALSNDDGRFRAELTGVRSSPGSVRIVGSDGSRADASVEEN